MLATAIAMVATPGVAQEVVISQVYGGGGNTASVYRNDYVQLFNRGSQAVNLNGWSVQYTSALGTTWGSVPLGGSIRGHGYYLISLYQGPGGTTRLPRPDAVGGLDLDGESGKVALVNSLAALAGSCPNSAAVVDFVGYGFVNCARGPSAAPILQNATAAVRLALGCTDADDNGYDFVAATPAPANSTLQNHCTKGDIDYDGAKDVGIWRGGSGSWYFKLSVTANVEFLHANWGTANHRDKPVPGDYDGDGATDFAVWRPHDGTWYILTSSSGYAQSMTFQWGAGWLGDVPVPADYDGDGRTDLAVWRPHEGSWYIRTSKSRFENHFSVQWGGGAYGDVPVPSDYDGDLRADIAVWRAGSGVWYVLTSASNYSAQLARRWGSATVGDVPVQGDYDGDGRSDMAVWRSGTGVWWVLESSSDYSTYFTYPWGSAAYEDQPVPGDYDGDGLMDYAVFRSSGTWFIVKSSSGDTDSFSVNWGSPALGDVPLILH